MAIINLRRYRLVLVAVIAIGCVGLGLNSINWVMKIIYPIHYQSTIEKYAGEYNIDPYLVAAIIRTESKFNEKAQSSKNARGLMQIAPITGNWAAQQLGIENYEEEMLFIPELNIRFGCWYLDKLRKEFDGRLQLMLAAYNGGSGNVNKWLKNPNYSVDGVTLTTIPFAETDFYIHKVMKAYRMYNKIYK